MALYTQLSPEELAAIAGAFRLGALGEARGIPHGSINTNYRLQTESGIYFLRHTTVRSPADLDFEAAFISHLVEGGFPAPTLVRTAEGACFLEIAGGRASVFRHLPGEELTRPALTPEHCEQLGGQLAKLHRVGNSFSGDRRNPYSPATVQQWLHELAGHPQSEIAALAGELHAFLEQAQAFEGGLLPRGAIHADLFMDNVKWVGDRISAFFDFEMACRDTFALDIAITLNAWCFDGRYRPELCRAFIRGYQARRLLNAIEAEGLYFQALFGAVRYSASRIRDFHLSPLPPERLARKDYRTYLARARALHRMQPADFQRMIGLEAGQKS
ncbi:MAG TPA: homoserine kinase [Myxococcaceae bacterium]|nr:homoserine kinase [Myxococcaceae bacterium]